MKDLLKINPPERRRIEKRISPIKNQIKSKKYLVLDYYVDEPACFGVPPFISPYVRYTYGALKYADPDSEIDYLTVDELRLTDFVLNEQNYHTIFLISGATVPGKYLGGKIGSLKDVHNFLDKNPNLNTIAGGPIKFASQAIRRDLLDHKNLYLCRGDIEIAASKIANGKDITDIDFHFRPIKDYDLISLFSVCGAEVIQKHFRFPYVITELETYQGCTRDVHCSFCSEVFYGKPVFRPLESILSEVGALYAKGARYFRLGRQADLYTYMPNMSDFKNSFPRPKPEMIHALYHGIHERAPGLRVLHLDNVNPGLIATFPKESEKITEIITQYNTVMDTAAMGMESADPQVIEKNDLKANPEEVKFAVKMIHKYGSKRQNGLPKLTAGLNFISGLSGESQKTFEMNYKFLMSLLEEGIFLRRINIRQAWIFERTKLAYSMKNAKIYGKKNLKQKFIYYRKKIRNDIDKKMLAMSFPKGSIIRDVVLEKKVPYGYLGRALGSYPITCHIWSQGKGDLKKEEASTNGLKQNIQNTWKTVDVMVVGYKERSVYCLSLQDDWDAFPLAIWKKIVPKKTAYSLWQYNKSMMVK